MNLIQIANGMGDRMTFGDLPRSSYIIEKINLILPEDQNITVTTNGNDFITIYETLKHNQQNQLAMIIEADTELRLEIVTDIAFHEISERRREKQVFHNNFRIYMLVIVAVVVVNFYNAYTYHQVATRVIGKNYESSMLGIVKEAFKAFDAITNKPEQTDAVVKQ